VDLLLSDVVLPGFSGVELARRLRAESPQLRLVLVSGYTGDELRAMGPVDSGTPLLQKPMRPAMVARTVRQALDAPAETRAAV
jgi:CheY-like chemotaxis protein